MADDTETKSAGTPSKEFGDLYLFEHVFRKEIEVVNRRRAEPPSRQDRDTCGEDGTVAPPPAIELQDETTDFCGQKLLTPQDEAGLVGLSLSGGGIRSAAFCLGVLQALEARDVLKRVDYLSTVSGGGYIGCSLTASLEQLGSREGSPGWEFPYRSQLREDEPPALQHIRDYSNYLFPYSGAFVRNASIYARGLAVNIISIAPFLLFASALTLALYWLRSLNPQLDIGRLVDPFGLPRYFVFVDVAIIAALAGAGWCICRLRTGRWRGGGTTFVLGLVVILLSITVLCELLARVPDTVYAALQQNRLVNPLELSHFFITLDVAVILAIVVAVWLVRKFVQPQGGPQTTVTWLGRLALFLVFLLVVAAISEMRPIWHGSIYPHLHLRDFINPFALRYFFVTLDVASLLALVGVVWGVYRSTKKWQNQPEIPGGWMGRAVGLLAILLLIVVFAEIQPIVLAKMADKRTANVFQFLPLTISAITAVLTPVATAVTFLASKVGEFVKSTKESTKLRVQAAGFAMRGLIYVAALIVPLGLWTLYLSITYWGLCANGMLTVCGHATAWQPATFAYLAGAAVCLIIAFLMQPNANSLHPLYRDRLAEAFLFKLPPVLPNIQLASLRPKLSEISGRFGPYHLINAALNVEASKTANRRGRNADFFFFSPLFVGSKATDYVDTVDMEDIASGLDLATAMAVSGAAVSSNMGAQSIKPLTPSMALLNVRLGYWMRNPKKLKLAKPPGPQEPNRLLTDFRRKRNPYANYYFIAEMFGILSEQRKSIYLTDGGHIENLGIYELLRRRCQVIIAVDSEADPQMAFGSFNTLERYALIDMGIRIDLPWQKITNASLTTGALIDEKGDAPKHNGPHCAIGEITYPKDKKGVRKGILVYIKASLTGDENDYIFDYKKRNSDFPHETTIDQWFTEEQFEAYRALGFHAAYGLFAGQDKYAFPDPDNGNGSLPNVGVLSGFFGGANVSPPPVSAAGAA